MSKNIVVCCDGTSNKFGGRNTNVVKMYQMIEKLPGKQILFYDPGLGTFSIKPVVTWPAQGFYKLLGLAFGVGLSQNVLDAYRFIINNYEKGDRIYLFGFSRGAYTVRAVAGMILRAGLMDRESDHLLPYALDMYRGLSKGGQKRGSGRRDPWKTMGEFYETYSKPPPEDFPIHFMGIWDTVKSVGRISNPFKLPNTRKNGYVKIVRHALAIDERRGFFRPNIWANKTHKDGQDFKQVWFVGGHSDVGGGNPTIGLSQIALEWMMVEAKAAGLLFNQERAEKIFKDKPDYKAPMYNRLGWYWLTEWLPKAEASKKTDWKNRPRSNWGRRRQLDEELDRVVIHESAVMRKTQNGYKPPNFPKDGAYAVEPWIAWRKN